MTKSTKTDTKAGANSNSKMGTDAGTEAGTKSGAKNNNSARIKARPVKARHYGTVWLVVWACVIGWLFLHWHLQAVHQRNAHQQALQSALQATQTDAAEVREAENLYQRDYQKEGFFRRHFWSDSQAVQNDRKLLQSSNLAWVQAQENYCQLTKQTACQIVSLQDGQLRAIQASSSSFTHRAVLVGAATVGLGLGAWIMWIVIGLGGFVAVVSGFWVVLIIVAIAYVLLHYLF